MTEKKSTIAYDGMRQRQLRWITVTALLAVGALLAGSTTLLIGKTIYTPDVVLRVLQGEQIQGATFAIQTLRFPRMLAAIFAGAAFGMSGSIFQTMLRNPLASPDIIGITSGSSLAAVFCILVLNISGIGVFYASILSSLLVALTIYFLSAKGGFSGGKLILIGIGMQSMLGALVSYLLLKASQYEVPGALRWLNGSLNGIQLEEISWLIFIIPLVGFITVLLGKQLKILELGDLSAISLGLRLKAVRISLIVCGVLLIAFATGVTGPIAFVSFLSGPISLRLVGNSSSNILPSALVGALLVLISDFMGQYAFGVRFPVGIVTGVIGAPYLLYLLIRMNRGGSI